MSFSANNKSLAASTSDGKVLIWDTKTLSLLRQFHYEKVPVNSVSFLPDGEQLLSAGYDGTLKLWSMNVHSFHKESTGHRSPIYALAFAPDGKTIATGSSIDGELYLWDLASSQSIRRIHGHESDVWDLAFSHNGQLLAAGTYNGSIRLYTIPEGKVFKTLLGHSNAVTGVLFTPDRKQLVSSSYDKTIWSIETGERLYSHYLHGPVIHLLHKYQTLWAATELGSRLRLDLSTFYTDYCDLMKRIWKSVPWIWEEGRARFRERPTDHVCDGV